MVLRQVISSAWQLPKFNDFCYNHRHHHHHHHHHHATKIMESTQRNICTMIMMMTTLIVVVEAFTTTGFGSGTTSFVLRPVMIQSFEEQSYMITTIINDQRNIETKSHHHRIIQQQQSFLPKRSMSHRRRSVAVLAADNNNNNNQPKEELESSSFFMKNNRFNHTTIGRREMLLIPFGVIGSITYGKLLSKAISLTFCREPLQYPSGHEDRVRNIITTAVLNAAATATAPAATTTKSSTSVPSTSAITTNTNTSSRPTLRILEVGVGRDCRILRRGLYDEAIQKYVTQLPSSSSSSTLPLIEIIGLDFRLPNTEVMELAQQKINTLQEMYPTIQIQFRTVEGSITDSSLSWNDLQDTSYFDCIICCLTLCSVDDVLVATENMRQCLRPNGGTFGYVEHVAVEKNEMDNNNNINHSILYVQQQMLDPIQQLFVDNCHLHRHSEDMILKTFLQQQDSTTATTIIQRERFYVDDMWPVSCQCCGVIQLQNGYI